MDMAKTKREIKQDIVQPKGMLIIIDVNKYKPIPRFKSGCKNC